MSVGAAPAVVDGVTLQSISGTLSIKNLGVDTAQLKDGAVTNAKVIAAAAIDYSKLNLTGNIAAADLANGAIARVVIPFSAHSVNNALSATDYFIPLTGSFYTTLPPTAEASSQLTLTGYKMVVREIHCMQTGASGLTLCALRDDGADAVATGAAASGAEASLTGQNVTVAAGSKVDCRIRVAGVTTLDIAGFIVADVYP